MFRKKYFQDFLEKFGGMKNKLYLCNPQGDTARCSDEKISIDLVEIKTCCTFAVRDHDFWLRGDFLRGVLIKAFFDRLKTSNF